MRKLNITFRQGLLTSQEFDTAVGLLVSGQVATSEEAGRRAIAVSQRQQASQAAARQAAPASPIAIAWSAVVDRIEGYARPNSAAAEKVLDAFTEAASSRFGVSEDDLEDILSVPREALGEYRETVEDRETEPEDRQDAWDAFLSTLHDVDWTELPPQE